MSMYCQWHNIDLIYYIVYENNTSNDQINVTLKAVSIFVIRSPPWDGRSLPMYWYVLTTAVTELVVRV